MFYDENGKHVRTKKEICNEDGSIRDGCHIIKKGEVYERKLFGIKDTRFKSEQFLEEVKGELAEVRKFRRELVAQGDGDYYLKEEVIRLRYENQNLKAENKGLREKLDKAYEFMKKFVIEGKSMLDKFLEWIGEKVKDVRGR